MSAADFTGLQRENAFCVVPEEGAGAVRQRLEEEMDKFREEAVRKALEENAKSGKYTQAQAEKLGLDKLEGFKPATVAFLHTEHEFVRLGDPFIEHDLHGKIRCPYYGKCIHCGKEESWLRTQPADQRPSLYLCCQFAKKNGGRAQWGGGFAGKKKE